MKIDLTHLIKRVDFYDNNDKLVGFYDPKTHETQISGDNISYANLIDEDGVALLEGVSVGYGSEMIKLAPCDMGEVERFYMFLTD